ncbi:hypothetical protein OIU78_026907 [Salix suchowensis]|nr:hypothetical protein OIU78_026907 [Salix suchowensis]
MFSFLLIIASTKLYAAADALGRSWCWGFFFFFFLLHVLTTRFDFYPSFWVFFLNFTSYLS